MKPKYLAAFIAVFGCCIFAGCADGVARRFAVEHNLAYGGVNLMVDGIAFTNEMYSLGDSVDLVFSSGMSFSDIPVYDGYYARRGEMLVVCRGRQVRIQRNSGADVFDECGLGSSAMPSVKVKLNARAGYLSRQQKLRLAYSDERGDYESDEVFANFRAMKGGKIKEGLVYRGASPCVNRHNRASYASELMASVGVRCVIDLADSADALEKYSKDSMLNAPYWRRLYADGAVLSFPLQVDYASSEYRAGIVGAMRSIIGHEGPYYVHCLEGKDRTGFACLLIGALTDFSNEELVADGMETFKNYYGVTAEDDAERYVMVLDQYPGQIVKFLTGKTVNECEGGEIKCAARRYLAAGGMSETELDKLTARLEGRAE